MSRLLPGDGNLVEYTVFWGVAWHALSFPNDALNSTEGIVSAPCTVLVYRVGRVPWAGGRMTLKPTARAPRLRLCPLTPRLESSALCSWGGSLGALFP